MARMNRASLRLFSEVIEAGGTIAGITGVDFRLHTHRLLSLYPGFLLLPI